MQPKRSPLILATVALGVLALGGLAYVMLAPGSGSGPAPAPANAQANQPTPKPTASLMWVATRDIPPRTMLTNANASSFMRRMPYTAAEGAPTNALQNLSDVRYEMTTETITAGQPVTLTSFTTPIKRAIMANISIPSGFRAVAIYVDPTETAAGLVDVGDYVDVIAVHKLNIEKDKNQVVVGALQFSAGRLIGSDLKVLAVEKSLDAPTATPTPAATAAGVPAAADGASNLPPTPTPPPAATADKGAPEKIRVLLAAPVDVATRLVAAGDQGVLHITIRNPLDGDQTASPEAHEYPSRVINVKNSDDSSSKSNTGAPSSAGSPNFGPAPTLPPSIQPIETTPTLAPVPIATPEPTGPPSADVTVIRGTEKTRVLVPQR